MRTISLLINARRQSSRMPSKLLRPFAGTTLINIALQKVNQMDFFDHRYLGVAEEEFRSLLRSYPNVEVLRRSPEAVMPGYGDHRIIYAHYSYIESDYIFWLNPCHPLLTIETVKQAVEKFHRTNFNSYTSVVQTRDWVFDDDGNPMTNTSPAMLSTSHSKKFFKATHSFHIICKEYFLNHWQYWTMTAHDPHLIEIPEEENFDCDTPVQFETAEAVYKGRYQRGHIG